MTKLGVRALIVGLVITAASDRTLALCDGSLALARAQARPAGAEIDALVRQVLEERLVAGDIPDIRLLGGAKHLAIRSDLSLSRLTLGEGALPRREGYEFRLLSEAEAIAEAERVRALVYFIAVDRFEWSGDTATMSLGVDFVAPADPVIVKMCCCERRAQYRRIQNRWVFVQWRPGSCR